MIHPSAVDFFEAVSLVVEIQVFNLTRDGVPTIGGTHTDDQFSVAYQNFGTVLVSGFRFLALI